MKNIIKIFTISALGSLLACDDVDTLKPEPATGSTGYSAQFLLVNATPDAPALDLYINNEIVGSSVAAGTTQVAYNTVDIPSNGNIANTNIRSRATTGDIGGVLGASDLIYRAGGTNTTNFTASNGARYTLFAVDSITRPKPARILNLLNIGDVTYYSKRTSFTAKRLDAGHTSEDTTYVLTLNEDKSTIYKDIYWIKKYNSNTIPSWLVPIGIVPLGSSDVGGIRYYLWQDVFPVFATASDSTNRAGFRVLNASPNSSSLRVRLKLVSGSGGNISLSSGSSYIVSNAGGFTPSVGSRTTTSSAATFSTQTIAVNGTAHTYQIEVTTAGDSGFATPLFTSNIGSPYSFGGSTNKASNWTIVVSGLVGGTGSKALKVIVTEHN